MVIETIHMEELEKFKDSGRDSQKTTISSPRAKPEKHTSPCFPWKWDLPDIQSTPMQQPKSAKVKSAEKVKRDAGLSCPGTDVLVRELNSQISWIYEETSESETEDGKSCMQDDSKEKKNEKEGPFDVKFRDHIMKELLKQGKDMDWFVKGAKKALENLDKEHHKEPGLSSTARVSQELNEFLTASMRPFYEEKKREKRRRKKPQNSQKR